MEWKILNNGENKILNDKSKINYGKFKMVNCK